MGSSSITTRRTTERRGFANTDITEFFQQGNTLSESSTGLRDRPSLRNQSITTTTVTDGRGGGRTETVDIGGFTGRFSDISAEELERTASVFNARRELVQRRRLQPGRDQLFLSNP